LAWLEVSKAVLASWVAFEIASRVTSRWAKAVAYFFAVILGQLSALVVGAIIVAFDPSIINATDVAKSTVVPWVSLIAAGIGLYLGSRSDR
jgi:hypothetical protein